VVEVAVPKPKPVFLEVLAEEQVTILIVELYLVVQVILLLHHLVKEIKEEILTADQAEILVLEEAAALEQLEQMQPVMLELAVLVLILVFQVLQFITAEEEALEFIQIQGLLLVV
jgi:hypothetical protein